MLRCEFVSQVKYFQLHLVPLGALKSLTAALMEHSVVASETAYFPTIAYNVFYTIAHNVNVFLTLGYYVTKLFRIHSRLLKRVVKKYPDDLLWLLLSRLCISSEATQMTGRSQHDE